MYYIRVTILAFLLVFISGSDHRFLGPMGIMDLKTHGMISFPKHVMALSFDPIFFATGVGFF